MKVTVINMKKKLLSAILTAVMAVQLFTVTGTVTAADDEWIPPLSITEPIPEDDLFQNGDFDSNRILRGGWSANEQILEHITDENGGYLKMSGITIPGTGFDYVPAGIVDPGKYKFTGWFRTANEGEISKITTLFYYGDGTYEELFWPSIYINNEWYKAELYVEIKEPLYYIKVRNSGREEYVQSYCVDNFSLVPVESFPEGYSNDVGDNLGYSDAEYAAAAIRSTAVGKTIRPYDPKAEEQYRVGGLIVNHDNTNFLNLIARENYTEADIINYALQFKGTHVSDYMITVFSEGMTVYPSTLIPDFDEKYHMTEENGKAVDYTELGPAKGAHQLRHVIGTDYVGLWCEYFPTIGINPWLSFRMNDVHELTNSIASGIPSVLVSEFYFKNPQLYRVKHHAKMSYHDCALDYQYEETREFMLSAINDALNRYDPYGIELDYQREIRIFGIGAEYKGLDILNGFMRQVDDLVKVYEEKYGHEIKIGVRVGSTIQTNYDFGLDVVTWAAEDIIDLVIPTGHFESTDYDTPVRIWSSIMKPHGVEVAPCYEQNVRTHAAGRQLSSRTFTLATGFAANAFSQGADKIALFNYHLSSNKLQSVEKLTFNGDAYFLDSTSPGAWNLLTTIGSYDKLMTVDRRCVIGYNDTNQIWYATEFSQLPLTVKKGVYAPIRVPVGDVPEGATLTFKVSYDADELADNPPTVFVNSKVCTFVGIENCIGGFTTDKLLCYEIPVAAHDGGYMLAEIYSKDCAFTAEHVEVYVDVAD